MRHDTAWYQAELRATRDVAAGVRELTLAPAYGAPSYPPGSHLDVQLLIGGRVEVRSYSLVGAPAEGCYRIAVKAAPDSRGGSRAMWALAPGARLTLSSPLSSFELARGAAEYLLVAGGIGITPLVGMADTLARTGARWRLLYAGASRGQMAFLEDLAAAHGERLAVHASDEGARIDFAAAFAGLHPEAEVYLCGPLRMLDAARRAWAGRPAARLRYETFGSSGHHAAEAFTIRIPRLGFDVAVAEDVSMLDALEAAGVGVLADCRRGECGLCVVEVVAVHGQIDHRDVFLSEAQRAAGGRICACVSRVVGGGITIDPPWRGDRPL